MGTAVLVESDPFTDDTGQPADPTTVQLIYQPGVWYPQNLPGKVTVDQANLSHVAASGVYSYVLDTTGYPGRWRYRFVGTGALQAAGDKTFFVDDSPLR